MLFFFSYNRECSRWSIKCTCIIPNIPPTFHPSTKSIFNTIGSPVQMIGFLTPLLIFTFMTALTRYRKSKSQTLKKPDNIFYGTAFIALSVIIGFVFYQIVVSNDKPVLLPFEHGFQLSLASISQDAERLLPSFCSVQDMVLFQMYLRNSIFHHLTYCHHGILRFLIPHPTRLS